MCTKKIFQQEVQKLHLNEQDLQKQLVPIIFYTYKQPETLLQKDQSPKKETVIFKRDRKVKK